jgi:hypothetical protein
MTFADVEADALASGAVVAAFVSRGTLTEGDEFELGARTTPAERLVRADITPARPVPWEGGFVAVVESVHPAALLDPEAAATCHVWQQPGDGDLVVLRIYRESGAVLDDDAFAAKRAEVEGALRA